MNFLKKLGQAVVKAAEVVGIFQPLIQGVLPARGAGTVAEVSDDLTKIAGMISTVEAAATAVTSTTLTGPQKLQMATPLVAQVIMQSDILVGHKIKDAARFQKGCASIGSGMADVLSSLED